MRIHRSNKGLHFFLVTLLVFTLVGVLAVGALAAEKEKDASQFKRNWLYFWRWANFGILAFFLVKLLKEPLTQFFQESARVIRERLSGTEQACLDAEGELREVERRLQALNEEIQKLQDAIGERGELERSKVIANARQTADQMLERARLEAAFTVQEAKNQLRREVVDVALSMAEESIREKITGKDHERLVKEYLQDLRQTPVQRT